MPNNKQKTEEDEGIKKEVKLRKGWTNSSYLINFTLSAIYSYKSHDVAGENPLDPQTRVTHI
jgi:hypothetical protein